MHLWFDSDHQVCLSAHIRTGCEVSPFGHIGCWSLNFKKVQQWASYDDIFRRSCSRLRPRVISWSCHWPPVCSRWEPRPESPDGAQAPRHQRYLEHSWRRLLQSGAALMPLLLCFQRCCRRRLLLQLGARGQQQSGTLSLSQGAIRPWAWPQQSLQSSSSSCGLLYLIKPDSLLSLPIFFVDCFRRKILTILDSIAASLFENNYLSWQIVSDDKIQVSLLILRRGALSRKKTFFSAGRLLSPNMRAPKRFVQSQE